MTDEQPKKIRKAGGIIFVALALFGLCVALPYFAVGAFFPQKLQIDPAEYQQVLGDVIQADSEKVCTNIGLGTGGGRAQGSRAERHCHTRDTFTLESGQSVYIFDHEAIVTEPVALVGDQVKLTYFERPQDAQGRPVREVFGYTVNGRLGVDALKAYEARIKTDRFWSAILLAVTACLLALLLFFVLPAFRRKT